MLKKNSNYKINADLEEVAGSDSLAGTFILKKMNNIGEKIQKRGKTRRTKTNHNRKLKIMKIGKEQEKTKEEKFTDRKVEETIQDRTEEEKITKTRVELKPQDKAKRKKITKSKVEV